MATDARKHTTLAAGEAPTRAGLAAAIFSINDAIPVANATEQAQVGAAIVAQGVDLSTKPMVTIRADARGLHRIEYSYNGTVFLPASGVLTFASKSAADTWAAANGALLVAADECVAGGVRHVWTGTAWVVRGAYASLRRTTAVPINAGVETDIGFNVAGPSSGFVLGTLPVASLTIPASGDYEVNAAGTVSQTSGNYFDLRLYVNGALVKAVTGSPYPHNLGFSTAFISFMVAATAGQLVKLTATISSAGSIVANGAEVSIKRLG
jgi:hypothetical protein